MLSCLILASAGAPAQEGEGGRNIIISSFSTSVSHQGDPVKQNIAMACEKLNGVVITPDQVFSFNETVGEGSARNGYQDGAVLYRDSIVMEAGGGICQVSSTLFNALLLAGCGIVERHRHYQPVTYVPLGLDATIKYGKKDMRIKNVTGQPLTISAQVNDSSCTMIIYGSARLVFSYSLETDEEEVSLPFAEDQDKIRPGIEVCVYRKKIRDERIVERFLMYKDFYPPVKLK
jgi:vancomycin resistance protein YoaR